MGEPKRYIWVLPLIGGVLVLIGLLTPVFYFSQLGESEYYWLWGLRYLNAGTYGEYTHWFFELEPEHFTIFLFLQHLMNFFVFFLLSIGIIAFAYKAKKYGDLQRFEKTWLGMGITLIIIAISYIIETELIMNYYFKKYFSQDVNFWDVYNPGFAIIAPFIAGALLITATIASKIIEKREEIITVSTVTYDKFQVSNTFDKEELKGFQFCPECGQKIIYNQGKFCSNCGYKFNI